MYICIYIYVASKFELFCILGHACASDVLSIVWSCIMLHVFIIMPISNPWMFQLSRSVKLQVCAHTKCFWCLSNTLVGRHKTHWIWCIPHTHTHTHTHKLTQTHTSESIVIRPPKFGAIWWSPVAASPATSLTSKMRRMSSAGTASAALLTHREARKPQNVRWLAIRVL